MPVQIDEITAEVAPLPTGAASPNPAQSTETSPEIELRRQHDLLWRLEERAARVAAD